MQRSLIMSTLGQGGSRSRPAGGLLPVFDVIDTGITAQQEKVAADGEISADWLEPHTGAPGVAALRHPAPPYLF